MARYVDQLRRLQRDLRAAGFTRITLEASPSLVDAIVSNRRPRESIGQCIERLVTGQNDFRPKFGEGPAQRQARFEASLQAAIDREEAPARAKEERYRARLVRQINIILANRRPRREP